MTQRLRRHCAIILRHAGSPPSLHSSPDYTPHTHTTADTQLHSSNPNLDQWIGISLFHSISGKPAEIAQVNLLLPADPEDGGSDAGEATADQDASTAEFSDSVRAGSRDQKHQFDLGKNSPESQDRKLIFRT